MLDVRRFDEVLSGRLRPRRDIPNPVVYRALQQYPERLLGLVCLDPGTGSGALAVLEEGFREGCRGIKLAPLVHGFRFDAPVLAEVAAACGEQGYPVYSHVTPAPGSTTGDFAALARAHPRTNFILGHMGFGPYDSGALAHAEALPNLYLETSLGNYLALHHALARLGPGKLIFGSEFPLGHPKGEMENVRLLNPESHAAILGGNILRLLKQS
jgi:predicted TIM-barrel fold metal-dependent hydrolase